MDFLVTIAVVAGVEIICFVALPLFLGWFGKAVFAAAIWTFYSFMGYSPTSAIGLAWLISYGGVILKYGPAYQYIGNKFSAALGSSKGGPGYYERLKAYRAEDHQRRKQRLESTVDAWKRFRSLNLKATLRYLLLGK